MEPFELSTFQPVVQETVAATTDVVPTNPSTLTLALIGIVTFGVFDFARQSFAREKIASLPTKPGKEEMLQRHAA